MSDFPAEPDWSLLPRDPVRFFGLSAGFDRRELKRSYNQLIRRFKPERFPQEFQRIRAAYEQLEDAIRYGQSTEPVGSPIESVEWLAQATASPAAQPYSASQPAPVLPLHQRIQTGSVTKLYRELQDRPNKSPYDFYALAVMSDVVDRAEGSKFAHWIVQGLTAHPNEVGLSRLLHAYFRAPHEIKDCESLLVACSKIVREDLFFPLTEPLWRMLLSTQNFSHFRKTLQQCEANLKGVNIDNRLAFYMQILKPAAWVADADWIDEAFNFIEQNVDRIPSFLDYDLEILSRLRAYIAVREPFTQGDEIRQRLDQAMRDYFSEDQLKGDQSVLACQVLMAQDADALGSAFSDFGNPMYGAFFAVWVWISYDVGERHIEPPKEAVDETIWHPRTKTLLSQMERQTISSRLGIQWATRRIAYRIAQVVGVLGSVIGLALLFIMLLLNIRANVLVEIVCVVGPIACGLALGYWVSKLMRVHYWEPFARRISADCYRQIWQRELVNFLSRSHLTYQTLRAYLQSFPNSSTSTVWVKHYADQDYALPMFAIAQRFVV